MSTRAPRARQERLIQRQLPDELIVYDLERHKASCLNRMAMLTWQRCDGKATVADIAASLQGELGIPVDERAVWLALERLSRSHLLEGPVVLPSWAEGYSRREWVAAVGKASSVLVPTVISILSPMAAAAQSHTITPAACSSLITCVSTPCVTTGKVCRSGKGGCKCR